MKNLLKERVLGKMVIKLWCRTSLAALDLDLDLGLGLGLGLDFA